MLRIALGAAFAFAVGCAHAAKLDSVVTIRNQSSWAIHQLYFSPSDQGRWGPDQLGRDVIEPDSSLQLTGVSCDRYDIRVIDEDGDECVLPGVDLCATHDVWTITDADLLSCEARSE